MAARPLRIAGVVVGGLGALLLLVVAVAVTVVETDWGREHIRAFVESQLAATVNGTVRIGRLDGNPLVAPVLHEVVITDSEGRPFLDAASISWSHSLPSLVRRRILLTQLQLVEVHVVMDRPPDQEWNFTRIFAEDPEPEVDPDPRPGWGSWIDLHDVTIARSSFSLRLPWEPDASLPEEEHREQQGAAVAESGLERVVEAPGGYQSVMEFRDVEADLPRVLLAHPDSAAIPVEVASLALVAAPFRTPQPGVLEDAEGFVLVGEDALELSGLDLRLPGSRLLGEVRLEFETGRTRAALRAEPVSLDDLRFLEPALPAGVEVRARLALEAGPELTHVVAEELDATLREGRLQGYVDVALGEELRLGESLLTLTDVPTELLRAPPLGLDALPAGRLDGRIAADPAEGDANGAPGIDLTALFRLEPFDAPAAEARAEGLIVLGEEVVVRGMALQVDPIAAELVRTFVPAMRLEGELAAAGTLDGTLGGPLQARGTVEHRDPVAGTSRIALTGGADLGGEARLRGVRVGLEPVQVRALRGYVDGLPRAELSGEVSLEGPISDLLETEGVLTLADSASGVSRIAFRGGVRAAPSPRFRTFELSIVPLRMEVLGNLLGDAEGGWPIGGDIDGRVHLDGTLEEGLLVRADLAHVEEGRRSRMEGEGWIEADAGWEAEGRVRAHELALAVPGSLRPELGLRGSVAGLLEFEGSSAPDAPLEGFLRGDLEVGAEGRVELEARLQELQHTFSYAASVRMEDVDLREVSSRVPGATAVSGDAEMEGSGTTLAELDLAATIDLHDAEGDGRGMAASLVASQGRLRMDSLVASASGVLADVRGELGMAEGEEGELHVRLSVDSLGTFSPWLRTLRASDESATGADGEARSELVTRDVLAGALEAEGAVGGNIERWDARGEVEATDVLAFGHRVGHGTIGFDIAGMREGPLRGAISGAGRDLLLAGLRYDSASVDAQGEATTSEDGGTRVLTGAGDVAIRQDEDVTVDVSAAWNLGADGNEVRVERLGLEFPEASYRLAGPSLARWGPDGVEVEDVLIESDLGARIQIDARLPWEAPDGAAGGEGLLAIRELQVAHVLQLAQQNDGTRAILDAQIPLRGTLHDPVFGGDASLTWVSRADRSLPDVLAGFDYRERALEGHATVVAATTRDTMLVADAHVPIDLAVADTPGSRLLDEVLTVELRMDELALEALPAFTHQVDAVRGRADGRLLIEGRPDALEFDGFLTFDVPTIFVEPLDLRVERMAGSARANGRVLLLDSLVAHSRGPVRVSGEIDLSELGAPAFDLTVRATDARVIDTNDMSLRVDADLEVQGPFEAVDLTGEIRTRTGEIRIPEIRELAEAGPLSLEDPAVFAGVDSTLVAARDSLVAPSTLLQNLRVDVDVRVERDLWIRSAEANVEVYTPPDVGPLRVRTVGLRGGEVEVAGTINTDRGQYEFLGRRFDLARGSATFPGGATLDPLIRLTAEHEVQLPGREAIDIRLIVDGAPEDLDTELESTAQPPLSQTDLLSLVVFGRDAGSLLHFQGSALGGQGTAGVAALATQQFATVGLQAVVTELESETARALALDVLHIRPADLPAEVSTGEFLDVLRGTEIEAGRYLTSRLYVAGQARPTFVHPGALVEYQTDHGWVWRTSWRPRFLPAVPTLAEQNPARASVFGSFLSREWRF